MSVAPTHQLVPVCPEQLGGLPTPRPRSEIESGDGSDVLDGRSRVIDAEGAEVTERFLRGARLTAELAQLAGARRAIFKEGSPSCGVSRIRRADSDLEGSGVTTASLLAINHVGAFGTGRPSPGYTSMAIRESLISRSFISPI